MMGEQELFVQQSVCVAAAAAALARLVVRSRAAVLDIKCLYLFVFDAFCINLS